MEIIKKNIMIESSKSRVPGLIPTTEMGAYVYDEKYNYWKKISNIKKDDVSSEDVVMSKNDFTDITKTYFTYGLSGKDGRNGNWGKIPCDLNISGKTIDNLIGDDNTSTPNEPEYTPYKIVIKKDEKKILRYRNMMEIYYFLKKFYKETQYYQLCERKNGKVWILIDIDPLDKDKNINFKPVLPTIDKNMSNGVIYGINAEYGTLKSFFPSLGANNKRPDIVYYNFVDGTIGKLKIDEDIEGDYVPDFIVYPEIEEWYKELNTLKKNISNNKDCCLSERYNSLGGDRMFKFLSNHIGEKNPFKKSVEEYYAMCEVPYMNLPIYIESEFDDMGEFTTYAKEWIPGYRYYVGDVVVYKADNDPYGSTYKLIKGDKYELFELDDDINLTSYSEKIFGDFDCEGALKNKNPFIENGKEIILKKQDNEIVKYYLPLAYYNGYYSSNDKEFYFDDGEYNKDGDFVVSFNHWEQIFDSNYIVEKFKPIDNKSETTIIQMDSKLQTLKAFKRNIDDNDNELPGLFEFEIEDNKYNYDYLSPLFKTDYAINIAEIDEDDKTIYIGDVIYSIIYTLPNDETGDYKTVIDQGVGTKGKVIFKYVIGGKLSKDTYNHLTYEKEESNTSGIRFEETYNYTVKQLDSIKVDGGAYSPKYIDIDFDSEYTTVYNTDLDNAPRKVIISNIEYQKNTLYDNKEYIYSPLIKEEYKMGINTPTLTDADIYIDRGINAAFEKHFILGEINTYQDMEKYKNDYFNFAGKQ